MQAARWNGEFLSDLAQCHSRAAAREQLQDVQRLLRGVGDAEPLILAMGRWVLVLDRYRSRPMWGLFKSSKRRTRHRALLSHMGLNRVKTSTAPLTALLHIR